MSRIVFVLAISSMLTVQAYAQNALNQAFAAGNYEEVVAEASSILENDKENAAANFFKGASLVRLQKYGDAQQYLLQARALEFQPAIAVDANLVRAYAGSQQTEILLAELERLASNGFAATGILRSAEFEYLEGNSDYDRIKGMVTANAFPCSNLDQYKKLDFWVGAWDIYDANDNLIARSDISKREGGCAVFEDYRTLTGFVGSSINYFDPADSTQKQTWIDLRNSVTNYVEVQDGEGTLQMVGDQGNNSLTRMTFVSEPDGNTVTQTFENSSDGGETWSAGFFGKYVRRTDQSITAKLSAVLQQMELLFAENKMTDIAEFYTAEAEILEPGGRIYTGQEEIRDYWASLTDKGISWSNEIVDVQVDREWIYSISISNLRHLYGGEEHLSKTRALVIWKQEGSDYKIDRDFYQVMR